jgi:hypothetical protein
MSQRWANGFQLYHPKDATFEGVHMATVKNRHRLLSLLSGIPTTIEYDPPEIQPPDDLDDD